MCLYMLKFILRNSYLYSIKWYRKHLRKQLIKTVLTALSEEGVLEIYLASACVTSVLTRISFISTLLASPKLPGCQPLSQFLKKTCFKSVK